MDATDPQHFTETALVESFQFFLGDVASVATLLVSVGRYGCEKLDQWRKQRRLEDAANGDANAAASTIQEALSRVQRDDVPLAARLQVVLILSAFGEAMARSHAYGMVNAAWTEQDGMTQFISRLASRWPATLAPDAPDPKTALRQVDWLTVDALRTPYYQALWNSLLDSPIQFICDTASIDSTAQKPYNQQSPYRIFEQFFRSAYAANLSSPSGEIVRKYQRELIRGKADLVRQLLLLDMASWGAEHVFGTSSQQWDMPYLPLGQLYVEPNARGQHSSGPILSVLAEHLWQRGERVVVLQGEMGLGKSLTARMLTWQLAEKLLSSPQNSAESVWPVYIMCGRDLDKDVITDLFGLARRALHRHAKQIGLDIQENSPSLAPPTGDEQRVLMILDGLDEVVIGGEQLSRLFEHLRRSTSANISCLVLSRPQVVPNKILRRLSIPFITIDKFKFEEPDSLVQAWLTRWNFLVRHPNGQEPLTLDLLCEQKLEELAPTPVLLFMIAYMWERLKATERHIPRALLYERFAYQVARGKLEVDTDAEHASIRLASSLLRPRLEDLGELGRAPEDDDSLTQAMLWLMGRVAWLSHCQEQHADEKMRPLFRTDIEVLLQQDLGLRGSDELTPICSGLMLSLQADLDGGSHIILFGHRSFREYLVARFWSTRLRRVIGANERDRINLLENLLKGRLLQKGDQTFAFLLDIITVDRKPEAPTGSIGHGPSPFGWSPKERTQLTRLAAEWFFDESQDIPGKLLSARQDRRPYLRETALALRCFLKETPLEISDHGSIKSLLGWFFTVGKTPILLAPNIQIPAASLAGSELESAVLDNAQLNKVNLRGANLDNASLRKANLDEGVLTGASLRKADLTDACMSESEFYGANLESAFLARTTGIRAKFVAAWMPQASLVNATFPEADFRNAMLLDANLEGCNLAGAKLRSANLMNAKLAGATLTNADLSGANLINTDLAGADLCGADLRGASIDVKRNNVAEAIYDRMTRWPRNVSPPGGSTNGAFRDSR